MSGRNSADEVAELRAQIAALKIRVEALERARENPLEGADGDDVPTSVMPGVRRCYFCGKPATYNGNSTTPICPKCASR